jgi:hypothetical protein
MNLDFDLTLSIVSYGDMEKIHRLLASLERSEPRHVNFQLIITDNSPYAVSKKGIHLVMTKAELLDLHSDYLLSVFGQTTATGLSLHKLGNITVTLFQATTTCTMAHPMKCGQTKTRLILWRLSTRVCAII